MPRPFHQWLLVVLLILAIGGHWGILQTVAWTNMLAVNLRTESLEAAVAKTFDGQHPCKLCKVIAAGKKAERRSEFPTVTKKLEFTVLFQPLIFATPTQFYLQAEPGKPPTTIRLAPPIPPPRFLIG